MVEVGGGGLTSSRAVKSPYSKEVLKGNEIGCANPVVCDDERGAKPNRDECGPPAPAVSRDVALYQFALAMHLAWGH